MSQFDAPCFVWQHQDWTVNGGLLGDPNPVDRVHTVPMNEDGYAFAGQHFQQAELSSALLGDPMETSCDGQATQAAVLDESQYRGTIDLTTSFVTNPLQDLDLDLWASVPPAPDPSQWDSAPHASVVLPTTIDVTQLPQVPGPLAPYPPALPIVNPHPVPTEVQYTFFRTPRPGRNPMWEELNRQRKRANRRVVESRHRHKERQEHERIKSASQKLQDLNGELLAKERALTDERLALMEELQMHARCSGSAVSEYLLYTSQEIVGNAGRRYYERHRGRRARSASPAVGRYSRL